MVYIGTDIIEVDRIRRNIDLKQNKFLDRIFTKNEIDYCKSKANPAIHYAGRFAAKEAVKKAIISSGLMNSITMKEIEIKSVSNIPKVSINSFSNYINLSISHVDKLAVATAVITIS